ncbi:ABC transporter substrate-binding protein [Actinotignum urinale]|uniref:ABC transporter substrate-binding protein n=1 Tax=Actinotignum urinale TaxID=190146 RepID=A0AAW9HXX5_9ACTO|nr:ABC transporter substrate-binding protein [Actinotignum urinale]MDY5133718.1 ABC transporter substrate-binding protein [Actinotignum urinale]MDY5152076.1 ABC transporter substrate-binding protein [Actinotignum urinale]MDY5154676.1 ABC transporter substrate-binding protein [Actinotignum urinale]MDY5160116.1 ABC transporter substrate-binding protein [Actinotignum urinale]WIK58895.1 ABC transporter substrate-binding protein [Actinotignum urinale]
MKKLSVLLAAVATVATALAGCSNPDEAKSGSNKATESKGADISKIEKVDAIAAKVPKAIKDRGILRNGSSTDYPPAEFRDKDGKTPIGYDIDLTRALAKVMGLKDGTTEHAEFPTIIPGLGSKFDIGASAFTVSKDRINETNMITYLKVGSTYAVKKGNPSKFDPKDLCGKAIGVQTGTAQYDSMKAEAEKCKAAGKPEIKINPHTLHTDAVTKLLGGVYDAVYSDSVVTDYSIKKTDGQLEQVGDVYESAPIGIAVAKGDTELAKAVEEAMQYLMDKGYLKEILAKYGAEKSALTKAELNPADVQ